MFRDGMLDATPAILPERLERPTVKDMVPGTAHFIDSEAIWVDEERKIWVSGAAPLAYDPNDEFYVSSFVRVVMFDEGCVLDLTTSVDSEGTLKQFTPRSFADYLDEGVVSNDYLLCVGVVSTKPELKKLKTLFHERYQMKLSGKPLHPAEETKKKESRKKKVRAD